jgi:hypothetical protein
MAELIEMLGLSDEEAPATDETAEADAQAEQDEADAKPADNSDAGDKPASESDDASDDASDDEEGGQDNPDAYADFEMPEGFTLDETLLAAAVPLFQELSLTQEQAQKLVDFHANQIQASSQSQSDAFDEMVQGWQAEAMADSEFGGDAFEQSASIARSAIAKFGNDELKTLLNDHGLGNHPEMIRFMVKVGRLTTEDSLDVSHPAVVARDRVSTLYPNDRNE